jgi:hypothetical protein
LIQPRKSAENEAGGDGVNGHRSQHEHAGKEGLGVRSLPGSTKSVVCGKRSNRNLGDPCCSTPKQVLGQASAGIEEW